MIEERAEEDPEEYSEEIKVTVNPEGFISNRLKALLAQRAHPEGTDSGSCWRAGGYLPGDHTVKARGAEKGRVRQSLSPDDPRHQASVRQSSLEREARITDIGR